LSLVHLSFRIINMNYNKLIITEQKDRISYNN